MAAPRRLTLVKPSQDGKDMTVDPGQAVARRERYDGWPWSSRRRQ